MNDYIYFCMFYVFCMIFFGLRIFRNELAKCKIIDSIENILYPKSIIQTPCGKFLIGTEGHSIYCYNLETRQKFRIAGSVNQPDYQNGTRDESRFYCPQGLTLSKDLKTLFVAEAYNCVIRAICFETGVTTTFAGQNGKCKHLDGPKEKACFGWPSTLKLSPDGNTLIVSDHCKLRSICIETGKVDTIHIFEDEFCDFTFSPDGKHIYILNWKQCLKYNIKTFKCDILLENQGFIGCGFSKDKQLLFVANVEEYYIKVVNIVKDEVIDTITTIFEPKYMTISTTGKQLFICDYNNDKVQVIDISKYCTNFKTFLQLQLSKHSYLPPQVIHIF